TTDVELGHLDALIVASEGRAGKTAVSVVYDETREPSSQARERIDRLLSSALPAQCQPTYAVTDRSIAPGAKVGGYILSKILPLVVVVMVMLGAFYPAIDITAGERERGTLETTLSAPIARAALMTGKVVAVATLATISGVLNLASMSITVLEGAKLAASGVTLSLP